MCCLQLHRGVDLYVFKNMLDTDDDESDILDIVYHFVTDQKLQTELINYIVAEAKEVNADLGFFPLSSNI
jgi:hypothetical protein